MSNDISVWDKRNLEIAAQRQGETLQARELRQLEEGTEAVKRGTSNPLLWALLLGSLAAAPFTGGLSLIVTFVAAIAMSGGPKHMVIAAIPKTVDIVAPKAGCIRVISSLITIALVLFVAFMIVCVIAYAGMGGIGG